MTYFLREAEKISPLSFYHSKNNPYICNALHLIQAEKTANRLPLAFFMPIGYSYSSDPRVER
ncbi:MAG: hypothetical protein Q3Y16_17540 [Bacteroides sp.]|jgi:hypothetical protein|uniref:hypothetical protein n=1 Tax=Bacteroides sp. TaxID=29523 RepID=UPI002841D402|nr:hypothetical protein [Bacteroides sp.]MDR3823053.1 hypothetical protein [Bacteroides sp.]